MPPDALKNEMNKQFNDLRGEVERLPAPATPADKEMLLAKLEGLQSGLNARMPDVSSQVNYAIEAEYVDRMYTKLIAPNMHESMDIARANWDRVKKEAAFSALAVQVVQRRQTLEDRFYERNKAEIDAVVKARLDRLAENHASPSDGHGQTLTGLPTGPESYAYFKLHAPLITASEAVAQNVFHPAPGNNGNTTPTGTPVPPPANNGNTGSGAVPNGPPPGNGSPSAPGNAPGSGWDAVLKSISSASGAAQSETDQAGRELLRGRYAEALSMSKAALEFEPDNQNALAIYHAAKDRTGPSAGGEAPADWKGAAGAAGVGPAAGSMGGGQASMRFAGTASPGAILAAGEQAQNAARSAMKLGDSEGAVALLSKALLNDPNNPALLNLRAQAYGQLGRWEEALKDAAAGLALAPGNMALLNKLAIAQNRTHRYREALVTANAMIAADPHSAWGYAYRAHAEAGLGNRAGMLADINHAAEMDPSFRDAAAQAAQLQLPSDADVMFLFPGEGKGAKPAPSAAAPGRGKSFGVVVGAGLVGGLLLALGLLSTVLAPLKDTVVSAFTKSERRAAPGAVATAQPASAGGNVGGLIRGQYEISRQIGAGGMGMVYEGTDRSLGRRVAIKKMREELRVNPRERERFIIEAKTVASLHHPNIVDIYAIADEGEDVYLVFEYVDGKTVHDLVQAAGRLEPAEAVRVTRAMGEALTYAHSRGVIHRDMKPSNVMRTQSGQIKVMDFGIARMAKDALTRYSMTQNVVGTPPYMAPEQEQGVVRKESDVYSLAICAYEMLTGKLPFIGMGAGMLMNKINMSYIPPARAIAGLPDSLDEVFLKAFQADPDQRYRTPQEFVAALEAAAGGAKKVAGPGA
jgi:tetratricopeptide (TPR) repeat protein